MEYILAMDVVLRGRKERMNKYFMLVLILVFLCVFAVVSTLYISHNREIASNRIVIEEIVQTIKRLHD